MLFFSGPPLIRSASAHITRISCHELLSVGDYFYMTPNVTKRMETINDKDILRQMACKIIVAVKTSECVINKIGGLSFLVTI